MVHSRAALTLAFALSAVTTFLACAAPVQVLIEARLVDTSSRKPKILSAPKVTVIEGQDAMVAVCQEHILVLPAPELAEYTQTLSEGISLSVRPKMVGERVLLKGTLTASVDGAEFHRTKDEISASLRQEKTAFVILLSPGETKEMPAGQQMTLELAAEPIVLANAASVYWQAFAALPPQPDGNDPEALNAWVADSEAALVQLHKAAGMAHCDWTLDYSQGYDMVMPHLGKMRTLAKAAVARARGTLRSDPEQAHADLRAVFCAARHLGTDPLLISQLVRLALENNVRDTLAQASEDIPAPELKAWCDLLRVRPAMPTLAEIMGREREVSIAHFQSELAEADQKKRGDLLRKLGLNERMPVARLEKMLKEADADYLKLVSVTQLPPAERKPVFEAFEDEMGVRGNVISKLLIPAVGKAAEKLSRGEAETEALCIRLERQLAPTREAQ
ncbi:MAG: hypothetical protein HN976_10150 [Lentisphaerae bacterium]|nr:hypothetical protein [Lentisphaerota bacterium]